MCSPRTNALFIGNVTSPGRSSYTLAGRSAVGAHFLALGPACDAMCVVDTDLNGANDLFVAANGVITPYTNVWSAGVGLVRVAGGISNFSAGALVVADADGDGGCCLPCCVQVVLWVSRWGPWGWGLAALCFCATLAMSVRCSLCGCLSRLSCFWACRLGAPLHPHCLLLPCSPGPAPR